MRPQLTAWSFHGQLVVQKETSKDYLSEYRTCSTAKWNGIDNAQILSTTIFIFYGAILPLEKPAQWCGSNQCFHVISQIKVRKILHKSINFLPIAWSAAGRFDRNPNMD